MWDKLCGFVKSVPGMELDLEDIVENQRHGLCLHAAVWHGTQTKVLKNV